MHRKAEKIVAKKREGRERKLIFFVYAEFFAYEREQKNIYYTGGNNTID